jgi:hypothetical protein
MTVVWSDGMQGVSIAFPSIQCSQVRNGTGLIATETRIADSLGTGIVRSGMPASCRKRVMAKSTGVPEGSMMGKMV